MRYWSRKKISKYLVRIEKGSTFAIPNDEVSRAERREGKSERGFRSLKVNEPR